MRTQCKKCVMDKSSEITFDENGVCNFCHQAQKSLQEIEEEQHKLSDVLKEIINNGKGKKYDCLIGLSGGVDSSLTLHKAIEFGLRPLTFSLDNGWNDPKADANVKKLVEKLNVKHINYKIDLDKFRKLQMAFITAGLPNIEIPTDHILMALTFTLASQYGIKYVLSGGNVATESIMPASWSYPARDLVHIKDVYKKQIGEKLKGLPVCGLLKWNYYKWIKGIKIIYLLDYLDYNRKKSVELLQEKYDYQPYGEKHCESVFTWWFQNYYLFQKFSIDKRKAHLSSLINSGQMTRQEALNELDKNPVYPEIGLEKMIMKYPKRSHYDFKTDEKFFKFISSIIRTIKNLWK